MVVHPPTAEELSQALAILGISTDPSNRVLTAEEIEKEKRRQNRIDRCGSYNQARLNPITREWYPYKLKCGYWRECELCLADRMQEFKDRLRRARDETAGNLAVIQQDKSGASKFTRTLRNADLDYWRVPTEGCDFIFFDGSAMDVDTELEVEDIELRLLALTPAGRRFSGDLGRRVVEEDEDTSETRIIYTPDFYIELPLSVRRQDIFAESRKRIEAMPVPTFDELQGAVDACGDVMEEVVKEFGGTCETSMAKVKVSFNSYNTYLESLKEDEQPPPETQEPPKLEQLSYQKVIAELFVE